MSTAIPKANITVTGPMTRGDLLMLLFWFADTNAVPGVGGIAGLARLTRLAVILGEETGLNRQIKPFFAFHATPGGGVASVDLWSELLALRAYQVVKPIPDEAPAPKEETDERRYLLENHIPAHERAEYPIPTAPERDVLTNKGTFFAAKREDQLIARQITIWKMAAELNRMPLDALTQAAVAKLGVPAVG